MKLKLTQFLKDFSLWSFFDWNLNGVAAYDFFKKTLIEASITGHNFDNFCLSETFSHSSKGISDTRLNINSSIQFGGIGTFWVKKIIQEKSAKFIKIFE